MLAAPETFAEYRKILIGEISAARQPTPCERALLESIFYAGIGVCLSRLNELSQNPAATKDDLGSLLNAMIDEVEAYQHRSSYLPD